MRIAAARDWLVKTPAVDTEDRVFRLLALRAADADVRSAADDLIKTQRPDGGWAQIDSLESDAYATGSASGGPARRRGDDPADPVYRRGVEYPSENPTRRRHMARPDAEQTFPGLFRDGVPAWAGPIHFVGRDRMGRRRPGLGRGAGAPARGIK